MWVCWVLLIATIAVVIYKENFVTVTDEDHAKIMASVKHRSENNFLLNVTGAEK